MSTPFQPRGRMRQHVCPFYRGQQQSPQQRFAQMFVRGTIGTPGYIPSVVQVLRTQLPRQYMGQPPSITQSPLIVPAAGGSFLLSPQHITSPVVSPYHHSTPNIFRQQLPVATVATYHPIELQPPVVRPPVLVVPPATTKSIPARFMPKYTDHHQYPPQQLVPRAPMFLPRGVHNQIQFPSPSYAELMDQQRRFQREREAWNYRDNNDDPIVISEDENIAQDSTMPEDGTKDLVSFDYVDTGAIESSSQQVGDSSLPAIEFDTSKKPPYSFSALVGMAISSSPNNRSSVKDIYNFISSVFPYYGRSKRAWKNSVRHCLKTSKCFKQVTDDSGNVLYWTIDKDSGENYMKGSFQKQKRKKRTYSLKPRPSPQQQQKDVGVSGTSLSLDSIWLLYADELNLRIIPSSTSEIYELVPPNTPPLSSKECFIG